MSPLPAIPHRSNQRYFERNRAFTLIEIAIVLLIVGFLLVIVAAPTAVAMKQKRTEETKSKLATIESALALFVAQNYRLPCPALGTVDSTDSAVSASAGTERVDIPAAPTACAPANQQGGILPWKALGLSVTDAMDGWGNMFTYRVDASMIRIQSMNLTMCTPGGTNPVAGGSAPNLTCLTCSQGADLATCTSPRTVSAGRGIQVKDAANPTIVLANPTDVPSTGAAYVVLSHGENGIGAYTQVGTFNSAGSPAAGTEEAKNAANAVLAYMVDGTMSYNEGTSHFDDLVLRRSMLSVVTKAQLGPRSY